MINEESRGPAELMCRCTSACAKLLRSVDGFSSTAEQCSAGACGYSSWMSHIFELSCDLASTPAPSGAAKSSSAVMPWLRHQVHDRGAFDHLQPKWLAAPPATSGAAKPPILLDAVQKPHQVPRSRVGNHAVRILSPSERARQLSGSVSRAGHPTPVLPACSMQNCKHHVGSAPAHPAEQTAGVAHNTQTGPLRPDSAGGWPAAALAQDCKRGQGPRGVRSAPALIPLDTSSGALPHLAHAGAPRPCSSPLAPQQARNQAYEAPKPNARFTSAVAIRPPANTMRGLALAPATPLRNFEKPVRECRMLRGLRSAPDARYRQPASQPETGTATVIGNRESLPSSASILHLSRTP